MMSRLRYLLVLGLLACLASPSRAGDDDCRGAKPAALPDAPLKFAGFDVESGRDLRVYPPHPMCDFRHMKLEIVSPDMNVPGLSATQTLTIAPIAEPLHALTLDARAMNITSVAIAGHSAAFEHDGRRLSISIEPPLPLGEPADIVTTYEVNDPPLGLIWTPESPDWPGRAAQLHTQGQPETNSFWFPCHDFPNVRLTTEIIAAVPAGYLVSSNGRLVGKHQTIRTVEGPAGSADLAPFEVFHWVQDKPNVNYLV